jgi:hypothetical protein
MFCRWRTRCIYRSSNPRYRVRPAARKRAQGWPALAMRGRSSAALLVERPAAAWRTEHTAAPTDAELLYRVVQGVWHFHRARMDKPTPNFSTVYFKARVLLCSGGSHGTGTAAGPVHHVSLLWARPHPFCSRVSQYAGLPSRTMTVCLHTGTRVISGHGVHPPPHGPGGARVHAERSAADTVGWDCNRARRREDAHCSRAAHRSPLSRPTHVLCSQGGVQERPGAARAARGDALP